MKESRPDKIGTYINGAMVYEAGSFHESCPYGYKVEQSTIGLLNRGVFIVDLAIEKMIASAREKE